jgi:rod shape-determining protein MreB
MLRGLANRLADETEVPVHLVPTPLECVVQGAGLCLDSFDRMRHIFAAADS